MKNIFIGNLSFQTTESELQAAFAPYGEVARARIITDRDTGHSRGFGFVEMANDDEAAKAIQALDKTELGGRVLNVSEARPKTTDRTSSYDSLRSGRGAYSREYSRSPMR
jgi:cold-inducible RNA-binding protein